MTPLVLITGFLGAGKTTLLRHLLVRLRAANIRAHVILNDYANAELDSATLRDLAPDIIPITGGCVCCDSLDNLFDELQVLPLGDRDVVLVETNGTTDPLPLIERLLVYRAMQRYRGLIQVALVDVQRWQRRGENNALERMQVRPASHVLFTWLDTVDEARQTSVRDDVVRLNPRARVVTVESLAAELVRRVEGGQRLHLPAAFIPWFQAPGEDESRILPSYLTSVSRAGLELPSLSKVRGRTAGHEHPAHELAHRFTAVQLVVPRNLTRERLTRWLDSLPQSVLRAKGVVEFAGEPERYHFFQRVEESASFTELPIAPPNGLTLAMVVGIGLDPEAVRRQAEEHLVA
jgi:G3E family GTPase